MIDRTIYYNIKITFDRFVPDTTEETRRLALAQATSYTLMDYFNQYTYAEITANMISEIAYTETMTFWSTLISAPLIFLGSWTVKGTETMMAQAGVTSVKALLSGALKQMILSPIREVFEEIIKDSFIEALSEGLVDLVGLPEDLGFWLSSFLTSYRELGGALGQLSLGRQSALSGMISLTQAIASGDTMSYLENLDLQIAQQQADAQIEQDQKGFWGKMLKTDLLKGIFMIMPSLFFGSFSFFALSGLTKITTSTIKLSPVAYTAFASMQHRKRKDATIEFVGTEGANSVNNIFVDSLKKPSDLDGVKAEIDKAVEGDIPSTSNYVSVNPDPRTKLKEDLANKFNEIRSKISDNKLSGDYQFEEKNEEFEDPETVSTEDFGLKLKEIGMKFGLNIESGILLSQQYSIATIMDFYSNLFNPESDQKISDKTYSKIEYNRELFLELVNLLKSTQYNGLDIIVDENINPEVLLKLKTKFDNGEVFTNLEPFIVDVGCYLMGGSRYDGMVNSESLSNEKSFEKTEQNYVRLKVLSESMSGIPGLQSGADVPLRLMPEGTQYKKGDIIVFYRGEIKIVHRVEYVYTSNGETFYVTEGVNPETNPLVDDSPVAGEDIIGIVDLSVEAFIAIEEMLKNRFVSTVTAYGMPSSKQEKPLKYLQIFKRALALVDYFSKDLEPQSLTDREARLWYLRQEIKMRDILDPNLPLKLQAVQAFYLRNCLRTRARELMKDQKLAETLRKTEKNKSWDEFVKRTENKGYKGVGIWREIIESSMRSRQDVNDDFEISGWEVCNRWWKYFKIG